VKIVITRNISRDLLRKIEGEAGLRMFVSEEQDAIVREMKDADVLLWFWHRDHRVEEFFRAAEKLKWVHSVSAGVDQILPHFPERLLRSLVLTRSATTQNVTIAEHCLALMLALSRRLNEVLEHQREKRWERLVGDELYRHTVVIVGLGFVGREIARRCRSMEMEVVGVDLRAPREMELSAFHPIPELARALSLADYLVISLPLTGQTLGLIGRRELERIKPGARLINLSRGRIVDEQAMIEALEKGVLSGAACDVFETEPLPGDSVLWEMKNVIVSPHMAGLTPYMVERAVDLFRENLRRHLKNEPLLHEVEIESGF
jgi:D-2-hydroxyacid dehydrogenase (NADP+)